MRFLTAILAVGFLTNPARPADEAPLQEPVAFRVYQRDDMGRAEIPVVLAPGLDKATLKSADSASRSPALNTIRSPAICKASSRR